MLDELKTFNSFLDLTDWAQKMSEDPRITFNSFLDLTKKKAS